MNTFYQSDRYGPSPAALLEAMLKAQGHDNPLTALQHIPALPIEQVHEYLPAGCIGAAISLQQTVVSHPQHTQTMTLQQVCKLVLARAAFCRYLDTETCMPRRRNCK